ncbi:MAG: polysaccharide export protein [Rickettsiales bacterium]|nr:polysaccharide export protein [Rickettsiales bacterium]
MQKTKLFFGALSLAATLSFAALAAESVELKGQESEAVESALSESMQAPVPAEKAAKAEKEAAPRVKHAKSAERASDDTRPTARGIKGDNYTIQSGDVLQITVWKEADMDREVLVLPDGTVSFPLIGSFRAEGKSPAQVRDIVKQKLASLIPDASVTVIVKAALGNAISVIGQVTKPGELVMNHEMSVMQALSQAGGLTPYADESEVKVLRKIDGKETAIEVPYDDIVEGSNLEKNINLLPGDVVVVPTDSLF